MKERNKLAKLFRFPLGQIVATPGVLKAVAPENILLAILRHARADWGLCGRLDRQANNQALVDGSRLFSVYRDSAGVKFWIITEADRSLTTVLLPDEY